MHSPVFAWTAGEALPSRSHSAVLDVGGRQAHGGVRALEGPRGAWRSLVLMALKPTAGFEAVRAASGGAALSRFRPLGEREQVGWRREGGRACKRGMGRGDKTRRQSTTRANTLLRLAGGACSREPHSDAQPAHVALSGGSEAEGAAELKQHLARKRRGLGQRHAGQLSAR